MTNNKLNPETIILKGFQNPQRIEAQADVANIFPGHFLGFATGGVKFNLNGSAGRTRNVIVAIENASMGDGIETAYADETNVLAEILLPGMEVYAITEESTDISPGALVQTVSTGTARGTVASGSATIANAVGVCIEESQELSGSAAAIAAASVGGATANGRRIKIRII